MSDSAKHSGLGHGFETLDKLAPTVTAKSAAHLGDNNSSAARALDSLPDTDTNQAVASVADNQASGSPPSGPMQDNRWPRFQARLRVRVGDDGFENWFKRLEIDSLQGGTAILSVPTRFLKSWITSRHMDALSQSFCAEFTEIKVVTVTYRVPGVQGRIAADAGQSVAQPGPVGSEVRFGTRAAGPSPVRPVYLHASDDGTVESSPLEPRLTFDSFVVGAANRLAHAAARQIAETVLVEPQRFNPLYIHSSVGLGKTHLLHAIAWEVRRRHPAARVLYYTAERFRYRFVEAVQSKDALSFKELVRSTDILLIDDMEFLHGEKTSQEFDHTLNALLDGGKQVVVASARAPSQLDKLDQRMRSRLGGGMVAEVGTFDEQLRYDILCRRVEERRQKNPTFVIADEVLRFLAGRLTESGRELDGAVTRLFADNQFTKMAVTLESAEVIVRDLLRGVEPRRIKIEDILRVVSKHFGVSRTEILSERRHRAIVRPRQIGMWLAKTMTARSLPEIGRRFGGRDHTTVLHAIRKIEGELAGDDKLKAEVEDLKKLLQI